MILPPAQRSIVMPAPAIDTCLPRGGDSDELTPVSSLEGPAGDYPIFRGNEVTEREPAVEERVAQYPD